MNNLSGTGKDSVSYHTVLAESFSDRYQRSRDSWSIEPAMRAVVDVLLAQLAKDSLVLDLGAGRGLDAGVLLDAGHRVVGTDLVAVPEWADLATRYGQRVRWIAGNVLGVKLGAGYDAVLDNGCFHHQHPEDYAGYLGKVTGALRTEGLLVLSVFAARHGVSGGQLHVEDDGRMAKEFAEVEAAELLDRHGFEMVSTTAVPRKREPHAYLVVTARLLSTARKGG